MKIGIYNRFLGTLGGGERYMATMARALTAVGDVEVVSQTTVSHEVIRQRLGIDLSAVSFLTLDDPSAETAERASEKYDLFINASHLDPVCSRARRSVLVVYFPSVTSAGFRGWAWRNLAERAVRPVLSVPVFVAGLGHPEESGRRRFWWTNGEGQLDIPANGRAPTMLVPLASFRHDSTGPEVQFLAGDEVLATVDVPPGSDFTVFRVPLTQRVGDHFQLSIRSDTFVPPTDFNDPRRLGVAVGEITRAGWRGRAYRKLFQELRPDLAKDIYGHRPERPPAYVNTYGSIWTISRFVEHWTQRYWGLNSSLVHPPVDVEGIKRFGVVPKENIILNVGRFFEGHHNKKHLEMVAAFRCMVEGGLSGWKLILVGGVSDDPVHLAYLDRVRAAAEDLPVRIALDIPYEELRSLYARSSIYWHATGYGENERKDAATMEHFGITTVEAMAASSVPVVIGRAGQRETVMHGKSGLHWFDLDQLQARTWDVILNPELRAKLAAGARSRSEVFSEAAFERRVLGLVKNIASVNQARL